MRRTIALSDVCRTVAGKRRMLSLGLAVWLIVVFGKSAQIEFTLLSLITNAFLARDVG